MTTPLQARLTYSASESDANMLWATQFFAPDQFSFTEILRYFEDNGFSTGMVNGRMQGFFHGTGYGRRNHTILKTGRVVTVEPGLYYPGMGGVRLEDVVRVTKTGCKNLVRSPKVLEV